MRATPPLGAGGLLLTVVLGCAGSPTGGTEPSLPITSPPPGSTLMRGTVDLDRGTVDFAPVQPGGVSGFAPAIYGDQNVNVRLYNSRVVLDSSTSVWRWTADVGIRNLRPHYVGDEEASDAPLDTMGIYLFFVQDAVPGQPCAGCFARIANHDGVMSFGAPNQKYFHWPERLHPKDSPLGDTTRLRRTWTFETSRGVRSFSFTVLIAAAWAVPYETRWRVEYTGDVLPASATPRWKFEGIGGNSSIGGGALTLNGKFSGMFYRRDPIAPWQDAYAQVAVRLTGGGSQPELGLLLSDRVKLMGLGIANGAAGLISSTGAFLPGTTTAFGNGTHVFQLRKYAADSVVYFVDGARRGRFAYASLSGDTYSAALSSVSFGALPTVDGSNSSWDSVIYEIGASSP